MKVLGRMPYIDFQVRCEVMDDENPTEVTTGAIVTVTVTLIRRDMSTLFGDESVEDKNIVTENTAEVEPKENGDAEPEQPAIKRPAWQKQQKKSAAKKGTKKPKQKPTGKHSKPEESPAAPVKVKTPKEEKPKEEDSDISDSDTSEANGDTNDRSSEDEVKNSGVVDEDQVSE